MRYADLPTINGRKSFNGKAKLIQREDGAQILLSYNTEIATYNPSTGELKFEKWITEDVKYSNTTKTHIDSFLNYIGKPTMSKSEIIAASK